jgi:hypothetical protein
VDIDKGKDLGFILIKGVDKMTIEDISNYSRPIILDMK